MLSLFKELPLWLRLWLIFPLSFLNGWLLLLLFNALQPLSSLLVTAILLAFLLNFPIQFLQQRGLSRGLAIGVVFAIALLLLALLSLILVPLIVDELSRLVTNLPNLVDSGSQQLQTLQQWAIAQQIPGNLSDLIGREIAQVSRLLQATSTQLLNVVLGTISSLINIVLLLVLTIFMVLTGGRAWQGIFSWLPPTWSQRLQTSIQQTFQGYFVTQVLLAGILSLAQTLAFLVLGVPYAVLFGVSIGLATLIPYTSSIIVLVVSVLVALGDLSLGLRVLVTAITIGAVNDNVIAPRLVGKSIGLNPIWLVIALFVGGKIAGVLGLVIAVPIASVIKQTADFARLPQNLTIG